MSKASKRKKVKEFVHAVMWGRIVQLRKRIRAKTLRQPGGVFEEQQKKPLGGTE